MTHILHISDLHFGRTDPNALTALANVVAKQRPDAIVVSGDLTQSGRRREFEAAAAYLDSLKTPTAVVPGNHDTPVYSLLERFVRPWRRFEARFGPVAPRAWDIGGVSIIGVNSARRAAPQLDWSTGSLRQRDINQAAHLARSRRDSQLALLATHHPFRLGPGKAGSQIVGRAAIAMSTLSDAGISAVLTGHVHDTSIEILTDDGKPTASGPLLSISSGSATSTRQRTEKATVIMIEVAGAEETRLTATPHVLEDMAFCAGAGRVFVRRNGHWSEQKDPQ